MAEDEKIVQEENVSDETPSKETDTTNNSEQSNEQAFSKEQEARMQQLIAEATTKALAQGEEVGKRAMQGAKDREVAEAKRATRLAQQRAESVVGSLSGLDEESRKDVELAQLRSERGIYANAEKENEAIKAQEVYANKLVDSINNHLKELGIEPTDSRLDWATGEPNIHPLEGRQRLDVSVAKILKEEEGKRVSTVKEELKKEFAEMKTKLRVDLGLESQDKGDNAGGGDSDAIFMSKFGSGELDPTPANLKRSTEIQDKY